MQDSVTFLVKATGNRHKIVRCLNSIARQTNPNYRIVAFLSVADLAKRLRRDYPGITIISVADTADFVAKSNAFLAKPETAYVMYVNYEEVLAPNCVDVILSRKADVLLCNISRMNTKNRFAPRFSSEKQADVLLHMKKGLLLWNAAIKTEILQKNGLSLSAYSAAMQELFLLEAIAFSEKCEVEQSVLVYKDTLAAKQTPSFDEFRQHKKRIKTLSRRFQKSGQLALKQQLIMDFVVSQLSNYYADAALLSRHRKRRLLKKYLVL